MNLRYRIVDFEQGTPAWLQWRNSGISGSDIFKLVKEGKEMVEQLIFHKLANRSFNFSDATKRAMERGHTLEPVARELISELSGIDFTPQCLEMVDNPFVRVSLDGISNNGRTIIEIKCLGLATHDSIVESGVIPRQYYYQIQFQLFVTGARRALYVGYNPDSEKQSLFVQEVIPDWETIAIIMKAVDDFQESYNRYKGTPDVVAIAGYGRQGKDSVGKVLAELGYVRIGFADELKREAVELGILPENFTEEDKIARRAELVALGKEKRAEDKDYWLKRGLEASYTAFIQSKQFDFTDVRYLNELFGLEDFAAELNLSFDSWWIEMDGKPLNEEEATKTSIVKQFCRKIIYNPRNKSEEEGLESLKAKVKGILSHYGN